MILETDDFTNICKAISSDGDAAVDELAALSLPRERLVSGVSCCDTYSRIVMYIKKDKIHRLFNHLTYQLIN